jgi:hypothetical protein
MLMGGSVGSSMVPMMIGYGMKVYGPDVLTMCVLLLGLAMGFSYINAHRCLTAAAAERRKQTEKSVRGGEETIGVLRSTISASNLERLQSQA